ncbi:hypothetical protein NQ318_002992 [Aromia moschata]|uniref:Uncharacterized protein n=1 Tax=Aromia moschata TaxID=1265417 RepID=A0AAV8YQ44_9CUCU|nr:hypothetical protein NQ318_002992 [Aromia moschata]
MTCSKRTHKELTFRTSCKCITISTRLRRHFEGERWEKNGNFSLSAVLVSSFCCFVDYVHTFSVLLFLVSNLPHALLRKEMGLKAGLCKMKTYRNSISKFERTESLGVGLPWSPEASEFPEYENKPSASPTFLMKTSLGAREMLSTPSSCNSSSAEAGLFV